MKEVLLHGLRWCSNILVELLDSCSNHITDKQRVEFREIVAKLHNLSQSIRMNK